MERRRRPLGGLLWSGVVAALTVVGFCQGSSSHSLQYFETALSEPVQGLPQYVFVGYVDGQLFVYYDSNTRKRVPRVSWIMEVDKEDPEYWDRYNLRAQHNEMISRSDINTLMNLYNHTGGLHIRQWMYGCELRGDGSKGGYKQYGYDGRDHLAFDKETLTWTGADAQAQLSKRRWDADRARNQRRKFYLEEECIGWLKRYLRYGKEVLLRKERPKMKVTSRPDYSNMETLICRADGFYPKDIEVVWTRDGEVWEEEMQRGLVAPNSDGTFHTWISIKVNPKDKDRFRCRVDHASLEDPVDFVEGEPASSITTWLLVGCTILGVLLVFGILALLFWKKQQARYEAASTTDRASRNSGQGDLEEISLEGTGKDFAKSH